MTAPPSTYTGARPSYVFIAPYSTRVATTLTASVSKAATSSNGGANPSGSQGAAKSTPAEVLSAKWTQAIGADGKPAIGADGKPANLLTYSVSCDLTTVLTLPFKIDVTGSQPPAYDAANADVQDVTPYTIVVNDPNPAPTTPYEGKATLTGVSCPPPSSPVTIALAVTPTPISRAYLYLRRNPFFDDNVNVTVGGDGMLSGSDTSSVQEITAILTELAQTAAPFVAPALKNPAAGNQNTIADDRNKEQAKLKLEARAVCYGAISNQVNSAPVYDAIEFTQIDQKSVQPVLTGASPPQVDVEPATLPKACLTAKGIPNPSSNNCFVPRKTEIVWTIPIRALPASHDKVELIYTIMTRTLSYTQVIDDHNEKFFRNGIVAFFPVPATVTIACKVDRAVAGLVPDLTESVLLTAPSIVNLYTESHFLDPQRDFLSNPQDEITFSGGVITGHKFVGQSPAKTIVDTLTAPIRAIMPSVTVTQSVQVQSSGGKVTGTTNTTQTQTAPSKGP